MTETIKIIEELTEQSFDELWEQGSINLGEWVKAEKYDKDITQLRQLLKEAVEIVTYMIRISKIDTVSWYDEETNKKAKTFLSHPEIIEMMMKEE